MSESNEIIPKIRESENSVDHDFGAMDDTQKTISGRPPVFSRRVALGVIVGAPIALQHQLQPASAQGTARPKQLELGPLTKELHSVRGFERKLIERSEVLRTGTKDQILDLLFGDPRLPSRTLMSQSAQRQLFFPYANRYISSQESADSGQISLPMIPGFVNVRAMYDSRKGPPTPEQIATFAATPLFSGQKHYGSSVMIETKQGAKIRLIPASYAFQRDPTLQQRIESGEQVFSLPFVPSDRYTHAAPVNFDLSFAKDQHLKWVNMQWLQHPQITEVTAADERNPNLLWTPNLEGGYIYDLDKSPALVKLLQQQIIQENPSEYPECLLQQKRMLASLPGAKLLILSDRNVRKLGSNMQQASGAQISGYSEGSQNPNFIGQYLWRMYFRSKSGEVKVGIIVSNPELVASKL